MSLLVLAATLLACLVVIPLGMPGTWLMVIAGWAYNYLVPGDPVGLWTVLGTSVLALIAEGLEFTLAASYTRKYGGSRRASWGAIIGSIVGVMVGLPIAFVGSLIAAFAGAFIGAWVFEKSRGKEGENATRVATGALIGRVVASAMKVGIAMVMIVWILFSAWQ